MQHRARRNVLSYIFTFLETCLKKEASPGVHKGPTSWIWVTWSMITNSQQPSWHVLLCAPCIFSLIFAPSPTHTIQPFLELLLHTQD